MSSRAIRILGLVVLLAGVVGAAAAGTNHAAGAGRPLWFTVGFELIVALAGCFTWMLGRGRYGSAPLGLGCAALVVLIASVFGYLGAGRELWGIGLGPFLASRVLLTALLGALAGWARVKAQPLSLRPLVRGALVFLAQVVIVAGGWLLRGRISSLPDGAAILIGFIACVTVIGLLAAGVDLLVRGFTNPGPARG